MPMSDHFRPPLDDLFSWDMLHGMWPGDIVRHLNRWLPPGYMAGPTVRPGGQVEIDLGTFELDDAPEPSWVSGGDSGGGTAVATRPALYSSCPATLATPAELPDPDEYEVRVYDFRTRRRLVAAVEIASPANRDRPSTRDMFVSKCVTMLRRGVAVSIVDLVTTSRFNLYTELLDRLEISDPTPPDPPPATYAASCRFRLADNKPVFEAWSYPMAVESALPRLPLWLTAKFSGPLDLEASYEDACKALRIA